MAKNTVPLSGRVPEPLKERITEMAEEAGMSRSAMVRELVKEGIEQRERERVGAVDDDDRPDKVLGALLYDAEDLKHTSLLIGSILLALPSIVPIPIPFLGAAIGAGFQIIGILYLLTAFVGWLEVTRRYLDPEPAADEAGADAEEVADG